YDGSSSARTGFSTSSGSWTDSSTVISASTVSFPGETLLVPFGFFSSASTVVSVGVMTPALTSTTNSVNASTTAGGPEIFTVSLDGVSESIVTPVCGSPFSSIETGTSLLYSSISTATSTA